MLYISKEDFEAHCPFGIDAETDIFDSLGMFFNMAYMDLGSGLLGKKLAVELPDIFASADENDILYDRTERIIPLNISEIESFVKEYVIKRAMFIAIPSLDLVLTNNGFGVVQTKDIAPAIPERVNRLRQECYNDADKAFDVLIKALPANSLTKDLLLEGSAWKYVTKHLIWTAEEFQEYCKPESKAVNRNDLNAAMPVITLIENRMRDGISSGQFDAFIDLLREGNATWTQNYAIQLLLAWMTAAFAEKDHHVVREDGILLSFMDEHPEEFPKYYNSNQYIARHAESFSPKKNDGCFIFR